jgi:hypothetical protein
LSLHETWNFVWLVLSWMPSSRLPPKLQPSTETLPNKGGDWNVACPRTGHYISLGETYATSLSSSYIASHGSKHGKGKRGKRCLVYGRNGLYTKIGKVLLFPALTKLMTPYLMRVYEIVKARYFG